MEESGAGADRQSILQFMTTEHFTLQTARGVANAEITSRLQLYLGTLSSAIIALALTAAMPNTVSRAVARLQLSSLRVAVIGLVGSIAITIGVFLCLWILPSVIGAIIALLASLLVIVATLFGRVVISAATGRWLQKRFLPKLKSESVTLLLGVTFWVVMASLPYVWPIVVAGLLVTSLGLALTARYRLSWKKSEA